MLTATLCAFAASIAPSAVPQEPPLHGLEIVPLTVHRGRRQGDLPPFGTLLAYPDTMLDLRRDLLGHGEGETLVDELPVRYLEVAHADDTENARLSWTQDAARLFVTGEPTLLAAVVDELATLRALVGRPIEITAELYEGTDLADPPALLPAGDQRDAGRGKLLWQGLGTTATDGVVTFDSMRWSRYVRSANVEVAQKSSISNPVLAAFGEGLCAAVSVHALADSEDVVLFVQSVCGQRRRIDSMSTGVPGQPNLELPQLETTFATAAARVPAGGAMQIAFGGDALGGARLVLAFKARFPLPRSESPRPDVVLLPLGALVSPALRQHVSIPDSTPLLTDQIPQQETDGDETSLLEADRILDLVRQTVGDDTTLEYLSGHLLVRGTAAARQAATAAIAHLQARLLETTVVRAYVDLDEVASSAPFAAPTADRRTLRLHQIVLPILSGRHAFAFRGLESTAIRTMLAEIAQEASITVPFVETRQGGLWLACRGPDPLAGDAFDAGVQFDHLGTPSLRSFGAFGALHLGDSDSLRATRIETLPIGRPTAVATGTSIALDGRLWRPTLRVLRTTVPEKQ